MATTESNWLDTLVAHVEKRPIAVMRLDDHDWWNLRESRKGLGEFTTALPHGDFEHFKAPTLCLILTEPDNAEIAYVGLIGSKSAITTLQSRVKVKRVREIQPAAPAALVGLLPTPTHARTMSERLARTAGLTVLSPKLSGEFVRGLASVDGNIAALRTIEANLSMPRQFTGNAALQDDAIRVALRAFGLNPDAPARRVTLTGEDTTGLARIPIVEDAVIEHDARFIPGLSLDESDLTGRAIFTRGVERLEVITANRRALENAFGVDLIYFNVVHSNLAMLQYKMLKPGKSDDDWIFKPDQQLADELDRMRRFAVQFAAPAHEYRLNSSTFFLKFVKRDGAIRRGGVILPLDHYEQFVASPKARGPRGGLRVGYNALEGSYMREAPFVDLIRSGYIGAYSTTTQALMTLVDGVLTRGRAVVAAIQSASSDGGYSDFDPSCEPEDYVD